MSVQRRNRTAAPARTAKRPIDKKLVSVDFDGIVAAQQTTTLYTCTFPGTVTGLRWNLTSVRTITATSASKFSWAIVISPGGAAANTMSIGVGTSLYDPEQNVLAFGSQASWNIGENMDHVGTTKAMRKMKAGDKMYFIVYGTATNAHKISGAIQFFVKS